MKRIATFAAACLLLAGCHDAPHPTLATAPDGPASGHITYQEPSVTISGTNLIVDEPGGTWQSYTWTADVSGGEAPYGYAWTVTYDDHGSGAVGGNSDSVTFGVDGGDGSFYLDVTVTDKWGHTASASHRVIVTSESCGFAIYC